MAGQFSTERHSSVRDETITGAGGQLLRRIRREFAVTMHWTRYLLRAPIGIYRARLGPLLGHRFLLLEHVGRTSGQPRYAVLEVIGRPTARRYLVVSGFGSTSQWLRNVRANHAVHISVATRHREPAIARVLPQYEARRELAAYAISHPKLSRLLLLALTGEGDDPLPDLSDLAVVLPVVEFELRANGSHADAESD